MSILTSFKKLVDPNVARMEEAERKAKRETPKREEAGGPGYRCKVCGRVEQEKSFCPDCLADTMQPIPR
jgi:rubrerythrin